MADKVIGNATLVVKSQPDKNFGANLTSSAGGLGSKFGGAFSVAAGNLMSQAFTEIVKVAADTFIEGFNNYAQFEQLAGGVEKIFDQADQAQIFKDAQNAYKDLNLSANQYLESINNVGATFAQTMGDQRGYDTARRGMKAIADYASGTGRSVDELSQKYQMISRATSSYQSIADQFSGILPQTSADFLAQAQAAGLLSDEYTKLTEVPVAEYQAALTAMLEQGVDGLGLAGNTAAETANTVTGSLAGLSAAWSNFVVALFTEDADLQPYIDALGESLINAFNNITRVLGVFLGNMGELLVNGLMNLQTILDDLGAAMGAAVTAFVLDTRDSVVAIWEQLVANLETIWNNLQNMVASVFDGIFNTIKGVQDSIWNAITGAWNNITSTVTGAVDTVRNAVSSAFNAVLSTATNVWNAVKSAIETPINAARDAVSAAISAIRSLFNFQFQWPHIPLPHFSISGSANPLDWITQGVPSISVDWYARGGIVDEPTLIGAGEAGREAIVPLTAPNLAPFADAVAARMHGGGITINEMTVIADSPQDFMQQLTDFATRTRAQYA